MAILINQKRTDLYFYILFYYCFQSIHLILKLIPLSFFGTNNLVAEDGSKMAEQNREKSKEPEDEVPRQVYDIQLEETVGDLKREKAAQKTAFSLFRSPTVSSN